MTPLFSLASSIAFSLVRNGVRVDSTNLGTVYVKGPKWSVPVTLAQAINEEVTDSVAGAMPYAEECEKR